MFIRNRACWRGWESQPINNKVPTVWKYFYKNEKKKKCKTIHISNQFRFYHHKWLFETLWKKSIKSKWEVTISHLIRVNFAFYVLVLLGWGRERTWMQGQNEDCLLCKFSLPRCYAAALKVGIPTTPFL